MGVFGMKIFPILAVNPSSETYRINGTTPFPIRIEKETPWSYKMIEWEIHNVCNNNCSFCGPENKNGSRRWLTLAKYKEYVDKLAAACAGSPFWIQLTGGEPTLYPRLLELLSYIKEKGAFVSMISNGSRTLRWWKELRDAKILDYLFLTYHSEQTTDYQQTANVMNIFHDENVTVVCLITHVITSLELAFEAHSFIYKNTGGIILLKGMTIGSYDIYSMYTAEQLEKLKPNYITGLVPNKKKSTVPDNCKLDHRLRVTYNTGQQQVIEPQILIKAQDHSYLNWDCEVGVNTMRIDSDRLYRGVCKLGPVRSLEDDNIAFSTNSIKCTDRLCSCSTDMITTKTRPISLYPE